MRLPELKSENIYCLFQNNNENTRNFLDGVKIVSKIPFYVYDKRSTLVEQILMQIYMEAKPRVRAAESHEKMVCILLVNYVKFQPFD